MPKKANQALKIRVLRYIAENFVDCDVWTGKAEIQIADAFNKLSPKKFETVMKEILSGHFIEIGPMLSGQSEYKKKDLLFVNHARIREYIKEIEDKKEASQKSLKEKLIVALIGGAVMLALQELYKFLVSKL